jgi:hypothetical protein
VLLFLLPFRTLLGAALLKGPQNSPVSVLISRSGTECRVEIMRGIAGKAGQGAAATVAPSITPAAAQKTGAIARNLFFVVLIHVLS